MKYFFLCLTCSFFQFLSITGYSQGFKVSGTKLFGAYHHNFVIRGVNMPFIWYYDQSYKALDRVAELGANTVRIVWSNKGKASQLDSAINRCVALQMIPMVELHDVTGSRSADKLLQTVAYYIQPEILKIITRYQKYLLLNLANEWGDQTVTPEYWENAYKRAIDTLRNAGIKTTLVIDAPGWGQNITPVLEKGKETLAHDPLKNILFSVHMYGRWNDPTKIERKLQEAYADSLPLIVGEFGYNYNDGKNNLGCKADYTRILSTCQKLGYGYMPWSWTGNNKKNAWLDLADVNDWNTLTWWGKAVFEGINGIGKTARKASVFK